MRVRKSVWMSLAAVSMIMAACPLQAFERTVEQEFQDAGAKLEVFDQSLTFQERKTLKQVSSLNYVPLTGALSEKYQAREALKKEEEDFRLMSDLKGQLLSLPGQERFVSGEARVQHEREAEAVARMAIPAFEELKKDYEMVRPAILHNLLVNVGLKEQGLCWQWARDLTDRLKGLKLETFDLLWATARGGTVREHNTVVLVTHDRPLEDGLLLDGWKHSGKPFWIRVTDDKKHPWKLGEYYGGR